jgi:hypothetical protein
MMRTNKRVFIKRADILTRADGGQFGPCLEDSVVWFIQKALSKELMELLEGCIPKTEIWAGSGALFGELDMLKWNDWFPEALKARLLIEVPASFTTHIEKLMLVQRRRLFP